MTCFQEQFKPYLRSQFSMGWFKDRWRFCSALVINRGIITKLILFAHYLHRSYKRNRSAVSQLRKNQRGRIRTWSGSLIAIPNSQRFNRCLRKPKQLVSIIILGFGSFPLGRTESVNDATSSAFVVNGLTLNTHQLTDAQNAYGWAKYVSPQEVIELSLSLWEVKIRRP